MNKERILELADHIEQCKHAIEHRAPFRNQMLKVSNYFDMGTFQLNRCGSPGCIAGHAVVQFKKEVSEITEFSNETGIPEEYIETSKKARLILDLTYRQAVNLFLPTTDSICVGVDISLYDPYFRTNVYDLVTPKVAAETLRNFVKTGEVVWQTKFHATGKESFMQTKSRNKKEKYAQ